MQIDIKEITYGDKWVGKIIWICDYRRPDLSKKAIRHVPPTEVMVVSNNELPSNKKVYYSENHFVKLNAKGQPTKNVIAIYDNTGFRSFTGVPLNAFDDRQECIEKYNELADVIIEDLNKQISTIVESLEQDRDEIINQKIY